jgi:hypothetical protein
MKNDNEAIEEDWMDKEEYIIGHALHHIGYDNG